MKQAEKPFFSKYFDKLTSKRFCLGITGLSKSGKSTFITSLINQLLQYDTSSLPGFSPALMERIMGVKLHPLDDKDLPQFPYDQSYEGLTHTDPIWPPSTQDVSGCLLEIKLKNSANSLNPFSAKSFSLFLEIRDYPGEWLLDLPLRDMSYSRWCAQSNAQFTKSPRLELLGDLLGDLQQIDPLSEVDEDYLSEINERFVQFLNKCKDDTKSLSLIQPGRVFFGRVIIFK
jgi:predicted YcjX-like family ATPase